MKATKKIIILILVLFTINVIGQGTTKNIITQEGFEEGLPSAYSFYQYGVIGNNDWQINGYSQTGLKGIYIRANINETPDSWMVTPQIFVSSDDFYLSFWEAIHSFYYYYSHEVIISTGSGNPADGDFTEVVYTIPDVDYENYSEVVLPLNDYVGEYIYIAFRYQSPNGQWGDQWHIDNVMVAETDLAHDLACVKMNPVYYPSLETACNPEVTVKNFGYSLESTYSVNLTIEGTTYDETVEVNEELSILQENTIVFPDWVPEESGTYILNASVILSNDQNPNNDDFSIDCETFSPDDYSSETIYSIEYAPLNKSISLNTETGERFYLDDHELNYPYRLASMTWMQDKIIAVQRDICDVFVVTPTGKFIRVGNIPNVFYINGLAYDEVNGTLYGVGLEDDWIDDYLYIIDENWHATELFGMPQKYFIYGLAANSQGELYGISTMDGSLFTIDPITQQTEDIGIIDGLQQAQQIQDIGFDRVNDILYGTLAVDDGQIFTKISTDDATLDILGNYGFDSPFGACAPIPNSPLSIVSQEYEEISIYPNPTTDVLYIKSEFNIVSIEIYNNLGQLVLSNSHKKEINISKLNQGIYFMKIKNENGYIGLEKVIRE